MIQDSRNGSGEDLGTARAVLECLEKDGPLSRAAMAKRLDLSRTTLTNLINRFIDLRLVSELDGGSRHGRGRPGIPLDLDTAAWFALGAEFHSGRWVFALTNLKGALVETRSVLARSGDPAKIVAVLIRGIRAFADKVPGRLLPAVGIGVPGLVDWDDGRVIRADDLGWEDVPVREMVERGTGLAAMVLNRNRVTGLAEARYGSGRGVDSFIYIGIGTGISAAIMLSGALVHGAGYAAGEIGHLTVRPDGPRCRCGKRGCLQVMAAGGALAAMARKRRDRRSAIVFHDDDAAGGEAVCEAAQAGDATALECLREAARYLGMAAGNLVTTFNPEKILVGGPLVLKAPLFVDFIREEAERWAMPYPFSQVAIEPGGLDEFAGALGAAGLVLSQKLELSLGSEH